MIFCPIGGNPTHELQSQFPNMFASLKTRLAFRHCLIFLATLAAAQTPEQRTAELKTARYLDSIRKQPSMLLAFLHDMPKGGDLHNHLEGAVYAEDLIEFAAAD